MRYSCQFSLLITSLLVIGFLGCQPNDLATVQTGPLLLAFDNVVGSQDLKLNNLRTITTPFAGNSVTIAPEAKPQVNLTTDLLTIFNGSTKLSIAQYSSVMFDAYSTNIANNYEQMIRYASQSTQ